MKQYNNVPSTVRVIHTLLLYALLAVPLSYSATAIARTPHASHQCHATTLATGDEQGEQTERR